MTGLAISFRLLVKPRFGEWDPSHQGRDSRVVTRGKAPKGKEVALLGGTMNSPGVGLGKKWKNPTDESKRQVLVFHQ